MGKDFFDSQINKSESPLLIIRKILITEKGFSLIRTVALQIFIESLQPFQSEIISAERRGGVQFIMWKHV
jgi:hypothetical protein